MRAAQAEFGAEGSEHPADGREIVGNSVRQRGRGAEAGQVHGYDLTLGGQDPCHRVPGPQMVADAVQEQQRFARAGPFVRDPDRTGAVGRGDGEGGRGGHAAAPWGG